MIVRQLLPHLILAEIIATQHRREFVMIPKITLAPQDTSLPFQLARKQFPVRLAYCLTINKAQGQYLPQGVFSHGQLYVALSRATSFHGTKVVAADGKHTQTSCTKKFFSGFQGVLPLLCKSRTYYGYSFFVQD